MPQVIVAIHDQNKSGNTPPITMYELDVDRCEALQEKGYGIYKSVNEFFATQEQMEEAGVKTMRNNAFCTKINAVYGDLDIAKNGDGTTEEDLNQKKEMLIKAVREYLEPNVIIITKNGIQPIWKLEDTSPENKKRAVNVINGIIEWSKTVGSAGDKVKDIARVLRVPGFLHLKSEPFLVEALEIHKRRFSYEE